MNVTGIMVYYYIVCIKKLWYFCNEITMEQESELVQIGKAIDENAYSRDDKHISINNTINIDFIRAKGFIHEVKKSKKIEEAGIWQLKYYLYYLKQRGVLNIKGKIDYPLIRESITVELTKDDEKKLDEIVDDIKRITASNIPDVTTLKGVCKKCAYYELCYI